MRLIDADELKKTFHTFFGGVSHAVISGRLIDEAPTVDPVKHGRWESYTNEEDRGFHYCSECGQQAFNYLEDETIEEVLSNCCPHCGAKMDL